MAEGKRKFIGTINFSIGRADTLLNGMNFYRDHLVKELKQSGVTDGEGLKRWAADLSKIDSTIEIIERAKARKAALSA